jgi:hypothetical protein
MKLRKIKTKLFRACFEHDKVKEKKLWLKALRKSIKHKHTESIQ